MWGQVAAVGIEHLEQLPKRTLVRGRRDGEKETGTDLCTGVHLTDQEIDACRRDALEERFRLVWVLEQPSFRFLERLARAALDHVGHEGPGGTTEADERDAAVEALACEGEGVVDVLEPFCDAICLQILHVLGDVEWCCEDRAGVHEDLHAHGLGDDEDVRKDDGRIDKAGIAIYGLQCDLRCEFRVLA